MMRLIGIIVIEGIEVCEFFWEYLWSIIFRVLLLYSKEFYNGVLFLGDRFCLE